MAYGSGSGDSSGSTRSYPISYSFGILVLLALAGLALLRHLFGSVRADVGIR